MTGDWPAKWSFGVRPRRPTPLADLRAVRECRKLSFGVRPRRPTPLADLRAVRECRKLSLGVRPRRSGPPVDRSAEAECAKFSLAVRPPGLVGAAEPEPAGPVRTNDFDLASDRRRFGTRRAGPLFSNFAPVPASFRLGAAPADASLNTAASRWAPTNSGLGARSATGRASPATHATRKNASGVSSRSQAMAPGSACLMAGPVTCGSDSSRPRPALPASPAAVAAAIAPSSTHGLRSPVVAPDAAAIQAAKYPARPKTSAYSPA